MSPEGCSVGLLVVLLVSVVAISGGDLVGTATYNIANTAIAPTRARCLFMLFMYNPDFPDEEID